MREGGNKVGCASASPPESHGEGDLLFFHAAAASNSKRFSNPGAGKHSLHVRDVHVTCPTAAHAQLREKEEWRGEGLARDCHVMSSQAVFVEKTLYWRMNTDNVFVLQLDTLPFSPQRF